MQIVSKPLDASTYRPTESIWEEHVFHRLVLNKRKNIELKLIVVINETFSSDNVKRYLSPEARIDYSNCPRWLTIRDFESSLKLFSIACFKNDLPTGQQWVGRGCEHDFNTTLHCFHTSLIDGQELKHFLFVNTGTLPKCVCGGHSVTGRRYNIFVSVCLQPFWPLTIDL